MRLISSKASPVTARWAPIRTTPEAEGTIAACLDAFADWTGLPVTASTIHELTSVPGLCDVQGDGRYYRIVD
jgi:hypothetical protein